MTKPSLLQLTVYILTVYVHLESNVSVTKLDYLFEL